MKTPHQSTKENFENLPGVTLLIPMRNEEGKISKCLNSILNQSYPKEKLEIIVLDDFSDDGSVAEVGSFGEVVKCIQLESRLEKRRALRANKKQGISIGVQEAIHSLILCADADSTYSPNWIMSMVQFQMKYNKQFISGPVSFPRSKGFWKNFLMMDLAAMIGLTAGSIAQRRPIMASGANMMFTKDVFLEVGGYEGNEEVASGDDVFLMQKIYLRNKGSIGFVKNREAIAVTEEPQSFGEFIQQRIRWTSKSGQMIDKQVLWILVLNYFFYFFLFCNLFILPWSYSYTLLVGLMMLGVKALIDFIFFNNVLAFYHRKDLISSLFFMEFLHLFYVVFMGVLSIFGQYTWKGRSIEK